MAGTSTAWKGNPRQFSLPVCWFRTEECMEKKMMIWMFCLVQMATFSTCFLNSQYCYSRGVVKLLHSLFSIRKYGLYKPNEWRTEIRAKRNAPCHCKKWIEECLKYWDRVKAGNERIYMVRGVWRNFVRSSIDSRDQFSFCNVIYLVLAESVVHVVRPVHSVQVAHTNHPLRLVHVVETNPAVCPACPVLSALPTLSILSTSFSEF